MFLMGAGLIGTALGRALPVITDRDLDRLKECSDINHNTLSLWVYGAGLLLGSSQLWQPDTTSLAEVFNRHLAVPSGRQNHWLLKGGIYLLKGATYLLGMGVGWSYWNDNGGWKTIAAGLGYTLNRNRASTPLLHYTLGLLDSRHILLVLWLILSGLICHSWCKTQPQQESEKIHPAKRYSRPPSLWHKVWLSLVVAGLGTVLGGWCT